MILHLYGTTFIHHQNICGDGGGEGPAIPRKKLTGRNVRNKIFFLWNHIFMLICLLVSAAVGDL